MPNGRWIKTEKEIDEIIMEMEFKDTDSIIPDGAFICYKPIFHTNKDHLFLKKHKEFAIEWVLAGARYETKS